MRKKKIIPEDISVVNVMICYDIYSRPADGSQKMVGRKKKIYNDCKIHKTYMHEKNEYNVYIKVPQERRENEKFNNKM